MGSRWIILLKIKSKKHVEHVEIHMPFKYENALDCIFFVLHGPSKHLEQIWLEPKMRNTGKKENKNLTKLPKQWILKL